MKNPKKIIGSMLLSASILFTGCSTVPLPQDLKDTVVPQSYSMVSNKIEGSDIENKMTLIFEHADLIQNESNKNLIISFGGRFQHNNPKIKTDTPFIATAAVSLIHHGNGILTIKEPTPLEMNLLSVHTPIKSLVYREAQDIFENAVLEMDGKYLKQQQLLRIKHNLETLFN